MPVFLSPLAVMTVQHEQQSVFGGRHGLRDGERLRAALDAAELVWRQCGDLIEAAAELALALLREAPFIDGNRRTAADCMLTLLSLNGVVATPSNTELFTWTMDAAHGALDRPVLAERLRRCCVPASLS
ncbi:type II toxin-antitoxin system death-on-curing family toxin [Chitinimonas lacunae]|uniref:Type II toxin-antitoxin system death-on-curing family toxin n=1 Tax=Chitinimonas lacunae TaxID=1963018 RepID=A0ABV8MK59_9NEIS